MPTEAWKEIVQEREERERIRKLRINVTLSAIAALVVVSLSVWWYVAIKTDKFTVVTVCQRWLSKDGYRIETAGRQYTLHTGIGQTGKTVDKLYAKLQPHTVVTIAYEGVEWDGGRFNIVDVKPAPPGAIARMCPTS